MASTFTITLTSDQCNDLAAKLKGMGFGPEALEKGTLPEQQGCVLSYVTNVPSTPWPPAQATVTFTIVKKPWVATVGMIENAVKKFIGIS